MTIALAFTLFVSATFALWLAASVSGSRADLAGRDSSRRGRPDARRVLSARRAPGVQVFTWLLAGVAFWSVLGGLHALAATLATKVLLAKIQYIAICTVPPLWFLFTSEYAAAPWIGNRRIVAALWIVPAITILLAFTNEWHHAIWISVALSPDGLAVYQHGWWFWIAAAFSYGIALAGTIALVHTARQSPPPYRGQFVALICAAVIPWIGNLLFLAGVTRPGFDLTPVAFTISCVLFGSAFYRNHLFELVPVARDMVVDSLDDPVLVIDPERRVLDMNAAALQLIPASLDWVGRRIDAVLPLLSDIPFDSAGSDTATVMAWADGSTRHYDVRVLPLRVRRGRSGGWLVLLRDVTSQHAAAAERDTLQSRMQEQQRRESLSILAGGLAHDFNNLLTGIVGNADLLSMRIPAQSELGANVGAILLGAQRAADLVSKMLAYAGERHGSAALVDLDELVRDILDLLRASSARHCTIEYTGGSAVIHADPTQIRQVAMNLIINAADAVEEASGRVMVTTGSEVLSAAQLQDMKFGDDVAPGEYAFLEVRDNGPGMSDDTLRRIFHPFFTTKPTGHGLGLSAVQGIVLGHRGALRVDSSPGWGARFCVWFPLAADADKGGRLRRDGVSAASAGQAHGEGIIA